MKVLVRDEAGLEVCLDFDYGDTVGDVRNTLNAAVSAGCGVAEEALVPQPFDGTCSRPRGRQEGG